MSQVFNPFLPLSEYIPDGEPHVFGDRVYHFGSHDKEGGYTYCMLDYVVYSASVDDLTNWRYEGVSYRADQDPMYPKMKYMYAPDVVQGNDGRYYLYYSMSGDYGIGGYTCPFSVAVSDNPAGPYEFLGYVKNSDGSPMMKYVCFDPAVMNDDGVIRLYYGTQYNFEERDDFSRDSEYVDQEAGMFGRTREEILSYLDKPESCPSYTGDASDSIMGPCMLILEDDMLTVKEEAHHILPYRIKGTDFEEHPFFEGASMRKVCGKYYFVYSSWLNHELCYAVSDYPDRGFEFKGTIVSNADVGLDGRGADKKLNMTGTTHGSIIDINDKWYVFYHRLTHKSDYSRQACAERIFFDENGLIPQVEITSCGLNGAPLTANKGDTYPAPIACNITNFRMPHGSNSIYQIAFPNVTNIGDDRFIGEIENETLIGFKSFFFKGNDKLTVTARVEDDTNRVTYDCPLRSDERSEIDLDSYNASVAKFDREKYGDQAFFEIRVSETGECIGKIMLGDSNSWTDYSCDVNLPDGVRPLYLVYRGEGKVQLKSISF